MGSSQHPDSTAPGIPRALGSRHKLLYVEDDAANRMLVEDIIARRPDIELVAAVTGHQGIVAARTVLPDIILMDIRLPDISGLEVLQRLKHDRRTTGDIPVIAVSSVAFRGDIAKGLHVGFFRYLVKPYRLPELLGALDAALELPRARHLSATEYGAQGWPERRAYSAGRPQN